MRKSSIKVKVTESDNILYDLLINSEWKRIRDYNAIPLSIFTRIKLWCKSMASDITNIVPSNVKNYKYNNRFSCKLSIGHTSSGVTLIAVAKDEEMEIRSSHDQFGAVISKCSINSDPNPERRLLLWSPDCSLIVLSYSNGLIEVFDILGSKLFSILTCASDSRLIDYSSSICGIFFVELSQHESNAQQFDWNYKLIVINNCAQIFCYYVSAALAEYQQCFATQLTVGKYSSVYPCAVTDVGYHVTHPNLFFIVGNPIDCNDNHSAFRYGISVWRILSDYPHVKLVTTSIDEEMYLMKNSYGQLINLYASKYLNKSNNDWVCKISISPKGDQMIAVHVSGSLSLWTVPSLRLKRIFDLKEQLKLCNINNNNDKRKRFISANISGDDLLKVSDIHWWNDNSIVILRNTGALTISSLEESSPFRNLLGVSPEFFESPPVPLITPPYDERFHCLECEIKMKKRYNPRLFKDNAEESYEHNDTESDDDDDDEQLFLSSILSKTKSVIYSLTNIERFHEPKKKNKILVEMYRIVEFKKTTPEELFSRYLQNEEYGEALDLAKTYRLDTDVVYQRQWRNSGISVATIQDYLSKITKRSWVIMECIERVPDTVEATRALLQYGLKVTDLDTLYSVENNDKLSLQSIDDNDDEQFIRGDHYKQFIKRKLKERDAKMLSMIDFNNLSLEGRQICIWRKKLLRYLDRLNTYDRIINDSQEKSFDVKFFSLFRDMSGFEAAIHFARQSDWKSVAILFTYHGEETLPHRMVILANFPETTQPYEYRTLLPQIGPKNEVHQWEEIILRDDEDWVHTHCDAIHAGFRDNEFESEFYNENNQLIKFKQLNLTKKLLTEWFNQRACEIESLTSMVDNSLELVKQGIERKVPQLEKLHDDFETFAKLIYEIGISNDIDFGKYQKLSNFQKIELLMSNAALNDDNFLNHIKQYLFPFIQICQKHENDSTISSKLFRDYLVSVSRTDLSLCLKVFENSKIVTSKVHQQTDKLIKNVYDLIEFAIECVYACNDMNHLDNAFKIVECLPLRNESHSDARLNELNDRVDLLEKHLIIADILDQNGSPETPVHIKELQLTKNSDGIFKLFTKVTRNASKRPEPLTVNEWIELFKDLHETYQMCYTDCISEDKLYEIFVETLLTSSRKENFAFAATYMQLNSDIKLKKKVISFSRSIQLLISSAREYINSSNSVEDENISLANECLLMIDEREKQNNVQFREELDFIEALHLIHNDFNIGLLPVQIRLIKQPRIEIIERVLKVSRAYRKTFKILKLAQFLRVHSDSDDEFRDGKVLTLIAEEAFYVRDYKHCLNTCQLLIDGEHTIGWNICHKLGICEAFLNNDAKLQLLSFALTFCDDEIGSQLEMIINDIKQIKLKIKFTKELN